MTTTETTLVSRLRNKMGDNPSYEGKPIIADQVWEDEEYLEQINSSLTILFKGKKTALDRLTDFEKEALILHARIEMIDILTVDSTKYARYTMRDVGANRVSPQEFIQLAESLRTRLQGMLEESGSDANSMMPTVSEGIIKRYDRFRDQYIPSKFDAVPENLPFTLSSGNEGIIITIEKRFIPDYSRHYVYRKLSSASGYGSIIKEYYELQNSVLLDDEVVEGNTYTYTVFIEDINNNENYSQQSITYTV